MAAPRPSEMPERREPRGDSSSRRCTRSTRPRSPHSCARRSPASRDRSCVEQFQGGQSNPTYRVTAGERRYVLRRKPPGKLLPSAHAVDREYRVMAALAGTGVPVAKMVALCEDDAVIGTAFYLMEYVEGRVLWDPTLPGLTPRERARALRRVEPRAWPRCTRSTSGRRASATSASPASTSSGRSRAGRSSTRPAAPQRIRRDGRADRLAAAAHSARATRPRSCTAISASTT